VGLFGKTINAEYAYQAYTVWFYKLILQVICNMTNSKQNMKRSALAIALALSLMTGSAIAKGPFGHKGGGHHSQIDRMIEKLELTDEQAIQVEELIDSRVSLRASKFQSRSQIQELIDQGNVDQAADQAADTARERVYEMAKFKSSLEQILTPEQLAKMEENKLRKQKRAERRRQKNID
jgi:Spy/CpxP family protein refolding chaperone